jgi:hypothetical protein
MATVSATISAGSSTQTMLLSAVPQGLQQLAECGEDLPHIRFTLDELDVIVEGKQTESLEPLFEDGTYLRQVLPALDWWIWVADSLNLGRSMNGAFAEAEFEEQRAKLLFLLDDVLSSYTAALAEGPIYSGCRSSSYSAGLELLKRYRQFTRYVCAYAREMWPGVELGWLLKQA